MNATLRKIRKRRPAKAALFTLLALAVIGIFVWISWERIAVMVAPKKQAAQSRSDAAVKADELFWQTFHNGECEKIPNALEVLIAAYVQTPNDAVTAAHIAWLHNWRITERNPGFSSSHHHRRHDAFA